MCFRWGDSPGHRPAGSQPGEPQRSQTRGRTSSSPSASSPASIRRVCLIFNPAAKGDRARRFRRSLDNLATNCLLKPTTGPHAAQTLASEAVVEGFDTVVAVGGDGTIHEVLNGLAGIPGGLQRVCLGILPLGTANVFARELGIPLHLEPAWEVLCRGATRLVDLVNVEFQAQGRTVRRCCAQLAGAGLDARAVELVDWSFKKRAGFLAYIRAGLRAMAEPQPTITVTTPNRRADGQLVLVGNGRLYGGPFALFPHADLQDGQLEVRVFPRADWRTAFACGLGILTGRVGRTGGSTDVRTAHLNLTADRRVPLELDGEFVGELPARFDVLPQTLQVLVPR